MKTILVTGSTDGIGMATARALYIRGHHVIVHGRDEERAKESAQLIQSTPPSLENFRVDDQLIDSSQFGQLTSVWGDLSVMDQVVELAKQVNALGALDVLINNAGFYLSGLAEETTIEQGKQQFETNFWGTIKLTNELLPNFRKQRFGKIITLGSIMGLLNFPSAAYYGASKHALEGYFKSLRFELNEFNIKVAMVEPMGFKTGIISNSFVAEEKINDYDTYRGKIERFSKDLFENSPEPTPVINTLLKLIEEKDPTFSHPVGKGASVFWAIQHFAYKTFENSIFKNINKFK